MSKRIYFIFILVLLNILFVACCKQNDKIVLIKETQELYLKLPYMLSIKNDSSIVILDRGKLINLNINSGKISVIDKSEITSAAYSVLIKSFPTIQFTDLQTFSKYGIENNGVRIMCIDKNSDNMLVNLLMETNINNKSSLSSKFLLKSTTGYKAFYSDTTKTSEKMGFLTGNYEIYFSDSIVLIPNVPHFLKDSVPPQIPTLMLFETDNNQNLIFTQYIDFPYLADYNSLSSNETSNELYILYSSTFSNFNNKIYVSQGNEIYKLNNKFYSQKIISTKDRIVSFKLDNKKVITIEKSKDKIYSIHKYDLKTKKEIKNNINLPQEKEIYATTFLNDKMYVVYLRDDNFYLLIKNL
ncbi:MAG: hypothetical protein LBV69_04585 [Bacteroidales bacterium]|jgi:hypothetical protein|nr:hypothetical protein [Bacteroidales bacterium]